jgi:DNA-binding NarL/FixJ family response regulator
MADDHPIVRRGLKGIIGGEADLKVVGEASDSGQLMELVRTTPSDVIILDINMPGRSGLDLLRELKSRQACPAILVLSIHPEDQFAVRSLRAGAAGYLSKDAAPEELVTAIRTLHDGKRYISPSVAQKIATNALAPDARPAHETLSTREYEVFRLLASGRTVSEIAQDLSLSVKTVSTYRTRVLEKLGLENNAALMRYALIHGLA